MAEKDTLTIWEKFSAVIADEISTNSDFAQKINNVLGGDISAVSSKKKNRRSPAKIDPFQFLEQGEDKLAEALARLSIDELKDVISANGMDTAKLAMKWKNHDRLTKHIIEATKRKSSRGEAFWVTQVQPNNSRRGSLNNENE